MLGFPSGSPNDEVDRFVGKIGGWVVRGKVDITCSQVNNTSIAFLNISIVTRETISRVNNLFIDFQNSSIVARETMWGDACIWGKSTVSCGG